MARKKNRKVVKYRRPKNRNVGMLIFALIFAYMAFYVYTYMQRDKIEFYEVSEGGIVNDMRHTGLILRTEETKYTDRAGNINYYLQEGKKASVGTRIYSIDETGTLSAMLAEKTDGSATLSKENLSELKKQLSTFSQNFTDQTFGDVYNTKYTLDSQVLEFVNIDTLNNLDSVIQEMGGNFEQVRADQSGIVSYSVDSMETLTPEQVTAASFDKANYKKNIVKSGDLVETNSPVYKLITSPDWSIIFQMSEDEAALYNGRTSLTIDFKGRDLSATAAYSSFTGADGALYGRLDFTKYMEQFASERFVDFEVEVEEVRGLKIPRSSVLSKNFFLIPKDFLITDENGSVEGFYKEVYSENGNSMTIVTTDIFYFDGTDYYVDADENSPFRTGDYLLKKDSNDRYQIGRTASLEGVYNINKGYSVFRRIVILASNDEYYTVEKNTSYGLSVYDHIVLDATTIPRNGYVIYQ